jgi:carbon storage regulator
MLVLTRKEGEKIFIGENIVITVVRGSGVKIGIDAPKEVSIVRSELEENLLKLVEGK